ncbi:anhydro-N-acetylmuramic acid kinase [uncultured Bacteroides sp.]|uniref:anhydro-N-acetylmuramic acid kinase n=1 Tax=uncultured Bacteroides sp. TaxID=162156 RepID=UPI002AA93598|nr:anhydro-N-acetylmuramic acid kinase [uncultured Bacteroides sp.]
MRKVEIEAIGLMSGTSLDGLDVCCCTFTKEEEKWNFNINCAKGYSYPEDLKQKLGTGAQQMSALEFITFHSAYGQFLGKRVNEFMNEFVVKPDIIASHGHTIFHEPKKKIMFQVGDGAAIAAETRIPTVSDFRRLDIMLGGQGAPLVPIGDRLLFADYDYCLNIGGFSNISFEKKGNRIAFDISPVNYVINHYCRQIGLEFDRDGDIARKGNIHQPLLDELNAMTFYHQDGPKSLGREWVETFVYPMLEKYKLSLEDMLCTFYEHAAFQISKIAKSGKLLITGGGAFNLFLVERIQALCPCEIVIPNKQIIEYKEALIFAFLGTLYMCNKPNCLASVTGAPIDNIGGTLFKI